MKCNEENSLVCNLLCCGRWATILVVVVFVFGPMCQTNPMADRICELIRCTHTEFSGHMTGKWICSENKFPLCTDVWKALYSVVHDLHGKIYMQSTACVKKRTTTECGPWLEAMAFESNNEQWKGKRLISLITALGDKLQYEFEFTLTPKFYFISSWVITMQYLEHLYTYYKNVCVIQPT